MDARVRRVSRSPDFRLQTRSPAPCCPEHLTPIFMFVKTDINPSEKQNFQTINRDTGRYIGARYQADAKVEIRFKTWWRAFIEFYISHPFDLIYMEHISNSPMYDEVGQDESARYYQETREIIKAGQNEGLIRPGDITLINQFVRVGLVNVFKLRFSQGKVLTASELDFLLELSWSAIVRKA